LWIFSVSFFVFNENLLTSADIFLLTDYSLNSILYQRGVYPEESFIPTQHYGLTMYMSKNPEIKKYTDEILPHLKRKSEQSSIYLTSL
jgi:mitotic spindle assembly checkpoint protein MAD2